MCAVVATQVDSVSSDLNGGDQRIDQRLVLTDDRENRSVVVGIRVDVEEPHPGERGTDRIDDGPVAPLGEVGHGLEWQHGPTLGAVKAYYEARAKEYDDWWLGGNLYSGRVRPGWDEEVADLCGAVAALPPARTLDVACGTGFLTRHLRGEVVGLDQSPSMIEVAREQAPGAELVVGDALTLPFDDASFDRVFTGHFYGHLEEDDRRRFLAEARRVAPELVVVDSARNDETPPERMDPRVLSDGSEWEVYKRWFTSQELADELGPVEILHAGRYFIAAQA